MAGNVVEELAGVLKTQEVPAKSKTVSAEVSKVDEEGIVWVRLAGSEQETPTASVSTEVKRGDIVNVEWRNKKLYISGNSTNPAVGVQRVVIVEQRTDEAVDTAVKAKKSAEASVKIAGNTAQYFWHTETGTDTGAHITELPREDFLADPSNGGGNLLARSNGIAARDGLTELATFGADGIQIGQSGQTRSNIDYHSMQLVDKEGYSYFHVSDLRNAEGVASMTAKYIAADDTEYLLEPHASNTDYTVTVSDGSGTISEKTTSQVTFSTPPTDGAEVTIEYEATSDDCKAYTLGLRAGSGSNLGGLSVAEGAGVTASGAYSHAEGGGTTASGRVSHAEGMMSQATGTYSHAEGGVTVASGLSSHAEGENTESSARSSHSEGRNTKATGAFSHAEGNMARAIGESSHAQNKGTMASSKDQTAIGRFNVEDANDEYAFIIGNGTGTASQRSNAFTVDWDGNVEASGGFSSPTLTQSFTSQYVTNIYAEKWGKVVSVTLINMKSLPSGQNTTLFTLPSGWRPSHTCSWLLRDPKDVYFMRISIASNGQVQVYNYNSSALPSSSNSSQTCTFIAD